jgi:tetratricopeptide (TPR) repeat protein
MFGPAITHARRVGDRHRETETLSWWITAKTWGPAPVSEAVAFCSEVLALRLGDPLLTISALEKRGLLKAMQGHFEDARRDVEEAGTIAVDLGLTVRQAMLGDYAGNVELLAGNFASAERALREGYDLLASLHDNAFRATQAGVLAEVLYRERRHEEALAILDALEVEGGDHGAIRGKLLATRGDLAEGELLARETVALLEETDHLYERGNALLDLATIVQLAGRLDEAAETASRAVRLYEEKGDVVSAGRGRRMVEEFLSLSRQS